MAKLGSGVDIEFGGFGHGHGKFMFLRDFAFGPHGTIYALDGGQRGTNTIQGNLLVQVFTHRGKFLREFPIVTPKRESNPGDPFANIKKFPQIWNNPQRLVVNRSGYVFVTQPDAEGVQIFNPSGHLALEMPLPQAMAITLWRGRVAVLGSASEVVNNHWEWLGGKTIEFINKSGKILRSITLSQPLTNVQDMTADAQGNFYIQAATHQIYKFSPAGQLLKVIGSGTSTRTGNGSELIHSVAVDRQGNIYSMTVGNPGNFTEFNPQVTTVTQRGGEFGWGDSWSYPDGRTPIKVDGQDRIWVAATGGQAPQPVIMRLKRNYLQVGGLGVSQHSAMTLGLFPSLHTPQVCNIAYKLHPITAELSIHAVPMRELHHLHVVWNVYNMYKVPIAHGVFNLFLPNGNKAAHSISFTPPAFGWYMAQFNLMGHGRRLMTRAIFLGVTPPYANLPILTKAWMDTPWQYAFAGLPLMRLSPGKGVGKTLRQAKKAHVTVFFNLTSVADCTPAKVRADVIRYKSQVKYWEIMNEPNFSMSPAAYVAMIKKLYPLIKSIDPAAQVLGPDVCGIQLPWYTQFYQAGGKDFVNILTIHDYEGNETIDPVHWRWKIAALRKIMAKFGDAGKPIWNTERCISGTRGGDFLPATQTIRLALHVNLMASLGIPNRHDYYYYLNQDGFIPTYLWSNDGPYAGVLAMRTRAALIGGRKLVKVYDFGKTVNNILLGMLYRGGHTNTLLLSNMATPNLLLTLGVRGGQVLTITDSFGNLHSVPVVHGHARVVVPEMPIYISIPRGMHITVPTIYLGPDLARTATFHYSAKCVNLNHLNDGIWHTYFLGDPRGDSGPNDGGALFHGELPTLPQTLTITFPKPRQVSAVLVAGTHADNGFCALLAYNLQAREKGRWLTIQRVRTKVPPSEWVGTPDSFATTWYQDTACYLNTFAPLTTRALRLVVLRTTIGFCPDKLALHAEYRAWGKPKLPSQGLQRGLWLRQIQVYNPPHPLPLREENVSNRSPKK
jgi:hypothetical protein